MDERDFEKALTLLDNAISQDKKKYQSDVDERYLLQLS
jgi:hypothetical protein